MSQAWPGKRDRYAHTCTHAHMHISARPGMATLAIVRAHAHRRTCTNLFTTTCWGGRSWQACGLGKHVHACSHTHAQPFDSAHTFIPILWGSVVQDGRGLVRHLWAVGAGPGMQRCLAKHVHACNHAHAQLVGHVLLCLLVLWGEGVSGRVLVRHLWAGEAGPGRQCCWVPAARPACVSAAPLCAVPLPAQQAH